MNTEVKAYMESLFFEYHEAERMYCNDRQMLIIPELAEFMYNAHIASTRKTLEGVQRELLGFMRVATDDLHPDHAEAQKRLLGYQRQKLDQMISALERKGEE